MYTRTKKKDYLFGLVIDVTNVIVGEIAFCDFNCGFFMNVSMIERLWRDYSVEKSILNDVVIEIIPLENPNSIPIEKLKTIPSFVGWNKTKSVQRLLVIDINYIFTNILIVLQ